MKNTHVRQKQKHFRKAIDPAMLSSLVDHVIGPAGHHALTYLQGHSGIIGQSLAHGAQGIAQSAVDLTQNAGQHALTYAKDHLTTTAGAAGAAARLWNVGSAAAPYIEMGQEALKNKRDALLQWGQSRGGIRGKLATGVANTLLNPSTTKGATDFTNIPRTLQDFSAGFIGSLLTPHIGADNATKISNSVGKIVGGTAKTAGTVTKVALDPVSAVVSKFSQPEFLGKVAGVATASDKSGAVKKLGQDVVGYSGPKLLASGISDAASAARSVMGPKPTEPPAPSSGIISAPRSASLRTKVGAAAKEGLRTVATGVVGGLPQKPASVTPQIQRSYKNSDYIRLKKALKTQKDSE